MPVSPEQDGHQPLGNLQRAEKGSRELEPLCLYSKALSQAGGQLHKAYLALPLAGEGRGWRRPGLNSNVTSVLHRAGHPHPALSRQQERVFLVG